jgi:hypothetical protein
VAATELDAAAVVTGYKNLAHIERDFRSIKTDDLDLRLVWFPRNRGGFLMPLPAWSWIP